MDATLDVLPGEGEVQTVTRVLTRRECEECGEPAHYKLAYLLENYRHNRASKAFGRDDCSWSSDLDVFVCRTCQPSPPDGYDRHPSRFPASELFKHLFLYWREIKP